MQKLAHKLVRGSRLAFYALLGALALGVLMSFALNAAPWDAEQEWGYAP